MGEKLKIRAQSAEDIKVLSAMVQDGLVRTKDIHFDKGERRFTLLLNRFRWEGKRKSFFRRVPAERVRTALRFDFIDQVQSSAFDHQDADGVLELLAILCEVENEDDSGAATLTLTFAGDIAIRLNAEVIEATLDDVSDPWPVNRTPDHDV